MSVAAFRWAMEQGRRLALPPSERLVLFVLAAAGNEGCCGQTSLATDTGLVERHIRRLIDSLVARGLIRTERRGRVMHYHIVRANGMDPQPQHRTQSPVSEPEKPDTESGITADIVSGVHAPVIGIPAPESGVEGQYRTPVPVFEAQIPPLPRARVDSPCLEKKEEESESPVEREGEEGSAEGRGGNHPVAARVAAKRPHQLPDNWAPNDYSFTLGRELGLTDDEIRLEVDLMRDWALDKRQTGTQWDRRFNNWLRNEAKKRRLHGIRHRPQRTLEEEWGLGSLLTPVFDDDDLPPSERPGAPRLQ